MNFTQRKQETEDGNLDLIGWTAAENGISAEKQVRNECCWLQSILLLMCERVLILSYRDCEHAIVLWHARVRQKQCITGSDLGSSEVMCRKWLSH